MENIEEWIESGLYIKEPLQNDCGLAAKPDDAFLSDMEMVPGPARESDAVMDMVSVMEQDSEVEIDS